MHATSKQFFVFIFLYYVIDSSNIICLCSCPGLVYQLCDSLHARVQVASDGWTQVDALAFLCSVQRVTFRVVCL